MNLDGTPDEEDVEFYDLYGPWDAIEPAGLQALMEGFGRPWWVVGGHAIEAFTGLVRPHEDIDLVIFGRDVSRLREQLGTRYHLWSNHGGVLRPLNDRFPEPLDPLSQIWVREHALAPWIIDCPLNPDVDGRWQSKRDGSHVAELDAVTWVDGRGIRFLNPEIVLFFKAAQKRPKDEHDLGLAWPLLSRGRQTWLRDAVRRWDPEHPWNERLAVD